jgi:acetylornithine deacetylase/succinyl-diaminopimelate desuccinylase-like protein
MTDPLPLLRSLIRIPSVNPNDHPGTDRTGEQAVAEFLLAHLRRLGARAKLQRVSPGRPNVIGVFRAPGKIRRRILLAPHTDTVSIVGMTIDPFNPVVRGGKVFGRGASDTKGPMAAMLTGLEDFVHSPLWRESGLEITFAGLMGEEAGNEGAKAWAGVCPDYDLVIAGEPTGLRVVHAHKGAVWIHFSTRGRATHASLSRPEDNALYRIRPLLEFFEKKINAQLRPYRHATLGVPSATLTLLAAGSKVNITPAQAQAQADVRIVPGLNGKKVLQLLHRELPPSIFIHLHAESPPLFTAPDHPLVSGVADAAAGLDTAPWFCDAAIFAQRGMPAIALGPGSIHQAHTANEWISVAELRRGARTFHGVLRRLAEV